MNTIISTHKFRDGRSVTITRNPNARNGERIIESAVLSSGATWPLESLGVILAEHQRHADEQRLSFDQIVTLPDGLQLKFAFAHGRPFVARPLVDEEKGPPDYRKEVLDAIRSRITPERMAEVFAELPAAAQRRVVSEISEPPVRRTVRINRRKKS